MIPVVDRHGRHQGLYVDESDLPYGCVLVALSGDGFRYDDVTGQIELGTDAAVLYKDVQLLRQTWVIKQETGKILDNIICSYADDDPEVGDYGEQDLIDRIWRAAYEALSPEKANFGLKIKIRATRMMLDPEVPPEYTFQPIIDMTIPIGDTRYITDMRIAASEAYRTETDDKVRLDALCDAVLRENLQHEPETEYQASARVCAMCPWTRYYRKEGLLYGRSCLFFERERVGFGGGYYRFWHKERARELESIIEKIKEKEIKQ